MIITCCTDTYFDWAELFLRSFKITNDNNIPIHINGMKLSKDQMKKLKSIYSNLTIKNRNYNPKKVAEEYGVTLEDVKRCSDAVSRGFKHRCRFWMDFIVVDGRINWLYETLQKNKDKKWFLHIDIDLIFRESIQPLIDKIISNDVTCRFRPDRTFYKPARKKEVKDDMKIAGGMVGLNGENGIRFVKRWKEEIASKKGNGLKGRNQGWGQTTLYYAYKHFENKFNWGEIEAKWLMASCNPKNPIWCGHKKGKVEYKGEKINIPDRHALRAIFFKELKLMEK